MSLKFPEMPRTWAPVQTVPDHQVLLDLGDDTTAERFSDWLTAIGWKSFTSWHEESRHDVGHHEEPRR